MLLSTSLATADICTQKTLVCMGVWVFGIDWVLDVSMGLGTQFHTYTHTQHPYFIFHNQTFYPILNSLGYIYPYSYPIPNQYQKPLSISTLGFLGAYV